MTVRQLNPKQDPLFVDIPDAATVPFTGVTGKYGAYLKGDALGGNLSAVKGWTKVFDIRDYGAVDDDTTDCGPAYQSAINAAIAAAGTGPLVIYTPPTTSYWRVKTGIAVDDGTHTQFGDCRQIFFVGEGDASPIRVDVGSASYLFDLDFGDGQVSRRDQRSGFYNMTLVTSNTPTYAKGPDCQVVFGLLAADVSRYDLVGIHLVGIWSHDNHFVLINGSPHFDWLMVEGGFCGAATATANSIMVMSSWAVCDATDLYMLTTARFRGTTWSGPGGSVQYQTFIEVLLPQDFDSTLAIRRFYVDTNCNRMVRCTQVTGARLRVLHASNFVSSLGVNAPFFDLKQVVSTVIEEGEVELQGGSTIMLNATACDNVTVRHCRSDLGSTSVYVAADSTVTSVIIDECQLATDSPNPAGVRSDATVTMVTKNGVTGLLMKASATVTQWKYAKVTGAGTFSNASVANVAEVIGLTMNSGVANDYIPVATNQGQLVTMISDGTGIIAAGDPIAPGANGVVLKDTVPASHTIMGRAMTGAVAVANTQFKALYYLTWGA